MKPFAGAPWTKPVQIGGPEEHKRPDYFTRYQRVVGVAGAATGLSKSGLDPSKYEVCALNPGVAMDFSVHKYRLLLFTNDKVEPRGQFFSEQVRPQALLRKFSHLICALKFRDVFPHLTMPRSLDERIENAELVGA